jgi:hypothetical protein
MGEVHCRFRTTIGQCKDIESVRFNSCHSKMACSRNSQPMPSLYASRVYTMSLSVNTKCRQAQKPSEDAP